MECKGSEVHEGSDVRSGFNRDIVECKASEMKDITDMLDGFNRDIVECKASEKRRISSEMRDLIETLWNVKEDDDEEQVEIIMI